MRQRLAALSLGLLLCAILPAAQAQKATERSKQKLTAESDRAELQQRLTDLRQDITLTETARSQAATALSQADVAISQANRALRELTEEQQQTEQKRQRLQKEHIDLKQRVDAQQTQVAQLIREEYVTGNTDRIKLLLSGDNPNRINRDLQYMGYVSQAQAKLIETLRTDLQAVEHNRADVDNASEELREIAQEQHEQKSVLLKQQAQRATLLAQLSNKLATQNKQASEIERDNERLGILVERLEKLIEAQQKADAIAREQRRQAAIEQEKLRAERVAKAKARVKEAPKTALREAPAASKVNSADAIDADEPPPALVKNELLPDAGGQDAAYPRSFSQLRGRLRLPVRGEMSTRFGSQRGDGPSSRGVFIRAAEGTPIKAVAGGRVVFADWLRGFGNLIIVDHGSQYLTIYGNNQSVLRHPGDAVKTGDVIASAGNTGGNEQSGLYFEMRHQGRAFDPLGWVTIR